MGHERIKETEEVKECLNLSSMTIWDYENGGLNFIDSRMLETAIERYIEKLELEVVVSYSYLRIGVYPDHTACYAIVRRLHWKMKMKLNSKGLLFLLFLNLKENSIKKSITK